MLDLSERLGVSRSSFYWYFRSRDGLLDALLERWDALNTRSIVRQAEAPAATITEAVCNVFRCWVDAALFSPRLDLAVRDWARLSETARARLDRADQRAHGGDRGHVRAAWLRRRRTLWSGRACSIRCRSATTPSTFESRMEARLALAPHYLEAFTGVAPHEEELAAFRAYAMDRAAGATDFEDRP